MSVLGLGPRQADQVRVNAGLRKAPAAPAIEVYSGVLFAALAAGTLTSSQRRRLNAMVAVSSALFGLVRPDDPIPAYRLSADAALPGIGSLAQAWRSAVSGALAASTGLVWDLRSGAYAALGPAPDQARTVTSRILLERGSKRTVVSHHNKATKGHIVRALAQGTGKPRTAEDLADALDRLGYRCELHRPASGPWRLDVIVNQV